MRLIHLSVGTIIGRLYLVMAIVLIAGFAKIWLLSLLAIPLLISVTGGIHFRRDVKAPYMTESEKVQNQHALHQPR